MEEESPESRRLSLVGRKMLYEVTSCGRLSDTARVGGDMTHHLMDTVSTLNSREILRRSTGSIGALNTLHNVLQRALLSLQIHAREL